MHILGVVNTKHPRAFDHCSYKLEMLFLHKR
jgi:hypothetical protein